MATYLLLFCFRAVRDPRNGKRIALKKLPNVFQSLVSCRRVYRELKMLCSFNHENVRDICSAYLLHIYYVEIAVGAVSNLIKRGLMLWKAVVENPGQRTLIKTYAVAAFSFNSRKNDRGYAHAKIEYVSVHCTYISLQKTEYAYDTFCTLNSIYPDLLETYIYLFTPVQLYSSMTRWKKENVSQNLIALTILHCRVGQ